MGLGAIEYMILKPGPLVPNLSLKSFLLASLILVVFTGFTEELIFRGVVQSLALRAMGGWALIYGSLLFAVMHIGYRSPLDFIFVLIVGLIFSVIAYWSGSILGVSLVHGLANVTFFLLMPTVSQLPLGWLAANILGMIWIGMLIAIFCMIFTARIPLLQAAARMRESILIKIYPPFQEDVVIHNNNRPTIPPGIITPDKSPGVGSDLSLAKPLVNDELWQFIEPLLPGEPPGPKRGRPRKPDRAVLSGILFVLKTGIPWRMLPQEVGSVSGTTCRRRLRDWNLTGVWERVKHVLLERFAQANQINWSRASFSTRAMPASKEANPDAEFKRSSKIKFEIIKPRS